MVTKGTHNFFGNEVRQTNSPYNPGAYVPPYDYPVAKSTSTSTTSTLAHAEPSLGRRVINKLTGRQPKVQSRFQETFVPPPPSIALSNVPEVGSLSRYPAFPPATQSDNMYPWPRRRLPPHEHIREGRPTVDQQTWGVMKNPSRTSPPDEDPAFSIYSSSSNTFISPPSSLHGASPRHSHGSEFHQIVNHGRLANPDQASISTASHASYPSGTSNSSRRNTHRYATSEARRRARRSRGRHHQRDYSPDDYDALNSSSTHFNISSHPREFALRDPPMQPPSYPEI